MSITRLKIAEIYRPELWRWLVDKTASHPSTLFVFPLGIHIHVPCMYFTRGRSEVRQLGALGLYPRRGHAEPGFNTITLSPHRDVSRSTPQFQLFDLTASTSSALTRYNSGIGASFISASPWRNPATCLYRQRPSQLVKRSLHTILPTILRPNPLRQNTAPIYSCSTLPSPACATLVADQRSYSCPLIFS